MPKRKEMKPRPAAQTGRAKQPSRQPAKPTAPAKSRDWTRIGLISGAVVLVGAFVWFLSSGVASESSGAPDGVVNVPIGAPEHIEGDIFYEGHPAGGPHNAIWQNCGAYNEPIRPENAVHSLEHGVVWITYPYGDTTVDIDRLNGYTNRNPKVLVSPVEGQEMPVLVTAWGVQMEASDAGDPRINQFIVEFVGAASAPEPGAACSGGVGVPG